jgi:cellulose synthase/poly-beta-1,6-N-acetylglucosamine synthase-like glycosyltransferase
MKYPKISVLIPVLNDEKYIQHSIESIRNQDYRGKIEIILADGNSTDKTIKKIKKSADIKVKKREIILLKNPRKNTAIGRNICLFNSKGKYVLNFSSHMFLTKRNILTKLVEEIENQPESVIAVGGTVSSPIKENYLQKLTSIIFKSPLAGANVLHQNKESNKKIFVKGIAVGLYRAEKLKKEKGFDPKFWVNQDAELHYRLIELKKYKIILVPGIKIDQAKRPNLKKLVKQMYRYGKSIMLRFYKYPKSLHPLQLIPSLFVIYCTFLLISLILYGSLFNILFKGIILYIIAGLISSANVTKNIGYIIISPIVYLIIHISYGFGTIVGLVKPQIKNS